MAHGRDVLAKKFEDGRAKSPEGPPVCLLLKDRHRLFCALFCMVLDKVKCYIQMLAPRSMTEHSARLSLPIVVVTVTVFCSFRPPLMAASVAFLPPLLQTIRPRMCLTLEFKMLMLQAMQVARMLVIQV